MKYKIPKFNYSIESKMLACCKLVDGGCDNEDIACDECLFNPDEMDGEKRREFNLLWRRVFEKEGGTFGNKGGW